VISNFAQKNTLLLLCIMIIVINIVSINNLLFNILNVFLVFLGLTMIWRVIHGTRNPLANWEFGLVGIASILVGLNNVLFDKLFVGMKDVGLGIAVIVCLLQGFRIAQDYFVKR